MEQLVRSPLSQLHILYEIDGHLYTTFTVATQAGLPRDRALELAWGSQIPDANRRFTATSAAWDALWQGRSKSIMRTLHSLHGGGPAEVRKRRDDLDALIRDALRQKEPDWKVGLMIHAYGDSYAHTYVREGKEHAYGIPFGHAGDGHAPDKIGLFGQKYLSYVSRLFKALGGSGDAQLSLGRLFQIVCDSSGDLPGVTEEITDYAMELGMGGQDSEAVRNRLLADVSAGDVTDTMNAMEKRFAEAG